MPADTSQPADTRRAAPLLRALAATAVLSLLATLAVAVVTVAGPRTAAASGTRLGLYRMGLRPDLVSQFEQWQGAKVGIVEDFGNGSSWDSMQKMSGWASKWGASPYRSMMLVSMPMLPGDGVSTIAKGATGAYDAYWVTIAKKLQSLGMDNAVVRTGWEFNGGWFRWAAKADPAAYAAYYRHIVTAMRSVSSRLTFDWCPTNGDQGWDPSRAYPGDAYVDYVGDDVYDTKYNDRGITPAQRWQYIVGTSTSFGLRYWASFAAAHHKPLSFAEWGVVDAAANHNGGGDDDPYFITQMWSWIRTHDVAWETYFEHNAPDGAHQLEGSQFPESGAEFKRLFGSVQSGVTPPPTPPTTQPAPPTATVPGRVHGHHEIIVEIGTSVRYRLTRGGPVPF